MNWPLTSQILPLLGQIFASSESMQHSEEKDTGHDTSIHGTFHTEFAHSENGKRVLQRAVGIPRLGYKFSLIKDSGFMIGQNLLPAVRLYVEILCTEAIPCTQQVYKILNELQQNSDYL